MIIYLQTKMTPYSSMVEKFQLSYKQQNFSSKISFYRTITPILTKSGIMVESLPEEVSGT
jgi:hypothetical protein